jgi:hypothetical protein
MWPPPKSGKSNGHRLHRPALGVQGNPEAVLLVYENVLP